MNSMDNMKMKLLDDLEGEMDNHDSKNYQNKRNMASASKNLPTANESPNLDASGKDPEKKVKEMEKKSEKNFYLNPGREKLLKEVELQSKKNDPIMMRGQWSRGRG